MIKVRGRLLFYGKRVGTAERSDELTQPGRCK